MDDNFRDILDSLPAKASRSRLAPYGRLIDELLRRGRTYREIARIFAEKCQLRVSISTIHDFVRLRSRAKRSTRKRQARGPAETTTRSPRVRAEGNRPASAEKQAVPPVDEVHRRIAALKQRPVPAQTSPKQFHYDPSEPLHLPSKGERAKSGE
jgi:IS30 family transposase